MRTCAAIFCLLIGVAGAGCRKTELAAVPPPPPPAAPAAPVAPVAGAVAARVEVAVTEEGFVPSRIAAKKGVPVTLAVTRKTDKTCAREILFQGQPGKTDLPLDKTVDVTYTPGATGEIKFGCAMGMMIAGVLSVVE
ncbi:MAG TPA: cupredoxin domain-containing protein [Polyangia bacterium]|jgi:hypothetical protein|nr:cupredoxin domain-containing protein [Polyangia bacterium]